MILNIQPIQSGSLKTFENSFYLTAILIYHSIGGRYILHVFIILSYGRIRSQATSWLFCPITRHPFSLSQHFTIFQAIHTDNLVIVDFPECIQSTAAITDRIFIYPLFSLLIKCPSFKCIPCFFRYRQGAINLSIIVSSWFFFTYTAIGVPGHSNLFRCPVGIQIVVLICFTQHTFRYPPAFFFLCIPSFKLISLSLQHRQCTICTVIGNSFLLQRVLPIIGV